MSDRADAQRCERHDRRVICLKVLAVLVTYICLTWLIHYVWMRKHVPDPELSLALSFTLQQIIAILALLCLSFAAKFIRNHRAWQAARLHPLIREKLALHLTGSDQWEALGSIRKWHLREIEDCLVEILGSISGAGAERLSEIAYEFGLVRKWRKQCRSRTVRRRREAVSRLCLIGRRVHADLLTALQDPDPMVKVEAARALAHSGAAPMLAEVFRMALAQNRLVRAILAEALRPHAGALCQSSVRRELHSTDASRVVAALEMLGAWAGALALPELYALLSHINPKVRAAALRLLSQAGLTPESERHLGRALGDDDAEVRTAAAEACGKLVAGSTVVLLQHAMGDAKPELVLAAAHAMAKMGRKGALLLEATVLSEDSFRASAALEALEHAKLNRRVTVGM